MVLAAGRTARADAGFGHAGELAISADQPLVAGTLAAVSPALNGILPLPTTITPLGIQVFSVSDNGGSETAFSLAPAVDYFVADNVSLGLQVLVGVVSNSPSQGNGTSTTLYGVAPQIGYNLRIGDRASLWPKVFFAFAGSSGNGTSASEGTLGVFAPFLFHLAPHFYAGIGPDVSTQLFVNESNGNLSGSNPSKITTVGAMATFGGWFGG
jgi:hypothetical protein